MFVTSATPIRPFTKSQENHDLGLVHTLDPLLRICNLRHSDVTIHIKARRKTFNYCSHCRLLLKRTWGVLNLCTILEGMMYLVILFHENRTLKIYGEPEDSTKCF